MKSIHCFLLTFLLIVSFTIHAQTSDVQGIALLEFQQDHHDIKVRFERIAPTYLVDSTYTDSTGHYSIELEQGIYIIFYTKPGYLATWIPDTPVYQNLELESKTLETIGLSGALSGTLSCGTYKVGGHISVSAGQKLVIEPGTVLKFSQDIEFKVYGELIAEGTAEDSIRFTHYHDGETWRGIDFKENSPETGSLKYCIVEYSNDRGISVFKCSPSISYSLVQYNTHQTNVEGQDENSGGGAGICLKYSGSSLRNMIVRNNSGQTIGCGIYCSDGNPLISNSIIINNTNPSIEYNTRPGGGLMCSFSVDLTLENSVIAGNSNSIGGGICIGGNSYGTYMPALRISNCIIYQNNAGGYYGYGGGIASYNDVSLSVTNSLIAGNESENFHCDDPWLGVNVTVNQNLDSCDAYGNLLQDPRFVDYSMGDFRLGADSPCIDAGNNESLFSLVDFANSYRVWDGNGDQDSIVDMGAYEFGSQLYPVGIENRDPAPLLNAFAGPNPAGDFIYIYLPDVNAVEIYGISGKAELISFENPVDISVLSPGIYLLKVRQKSCEVRMAKIIKL